MPSAGMRNRCTPRCNTRSGRRSSPGRSPASTPGNPRCTPRHCRQARDASGRKPPGGSTSPARSRRPSCTSRMHGPQSPGQVLHVSLPLHTPSPHTDGGDAVARPDRPGRQCTCYCSRRSSGPCRVARKCRRCCSPAFPPGRHIARPYRPGHYHRRHSSRRNAGPSRFPRSSRSRRKLAVPNCRRTADVHHPLLQTLVRGA